MGLEGCLPSRDLVSLQRSSVSSFEKAEPSPGPGKPQGYIGSPKWLLVTVLPHFGPRKVVLLEAPAWAGWLRTAVQCTGSQLSSLGVEPRLCVFGVLSLRSVPTLSLSFLLGEMGRCPLIYPPSPSSVRDMERGLHSPSSTTAPSTRALLCLHCLWPGRRLLVK